MGDATQLAVWAPTLLLVAARVVGMLLAAPVLNSPAVPRRLRVFMGMVMALAVAGRIARPVPPPDSAVAIGVALACEALIGAAVGYAAALLFMGVELAAVHVAQQMGVGLAEVFSAGSGESSGPVRRLFWLLAVAVFLAIGGHRALISAVVGSFDTVPVAGFSLGAGVVATAAGMLAASFTIALKIAAPVLITLLLATVALGMLQRTLPQCHILSTGLTVRVMLALLVLAASLAVVERVLAGAWPAVMERISQLLRDLG